jgi:hypothetical protein
VDLGRWRRNEIKLENQDQVQENKAKPATEEKCLTEKGLP